MESDLTPEPSQKANQAEEGGTTAQHSAARGFKCKITDRCEPHQQTAYKP